MTFIAFYADCRHQILPVKSGYRLTITLDLLLEAAAPDEPKPEPAAELARYLTEHFTTRPVQRYSRYEKEPPDRLVYLLDHQYTEHSARGAGSRAPTPNEARSCGPQRSRLAARPCSRSLRSSRPGKAAAAST